VVPDADPLCGREGAYSCHAGVLTFPIPHEQIGDTGDRSWTFALSDVVDSASASEAERDEAVGTLSWLEDYRSIGPLSAMLEDDDLPASIRKAAAQVLLDVDDSTTGERRRRWWESGDLVKMEHALRLMEPSEADIILAVAADDRHPLQRVALIVMAFGFDEAEHQAVQIRALTHPEAEVRDGAAFALMWDEPVAAEEPLVSAASDPSGEVAVSAVSTLQYYRSRRVLRVLADLTEADDERVRAAAVESFDENRSCFEYLATYGDPEQVMLLREWMEPVADLVRWPEEVQDRELYSPSAEPAPTAMSESDLLALLADPDGEWRPKKEMLRQVDWERYAAGERARLGRALTGHPDPAVREIATEPLAVWSRSEELLMLTADPSGSVRKSAMYRLALVPRDRSLAEVAWDHMLAGAGCVASEALRTYVAHADAREAKERLHELALTDRRETIRTQAIVCLTDPGCERELQSLVPLLREPPGVSWMVHIEIIDGLRELGLPAPDLDHLATVDNLELVRHIVALRCASRR
jgi:HEAT repeat protein